MDGLPEGLTPDHFAAAATVWISHLAQQLGTEELRPALGVWGRSADLAGTQYPENQARLARLREMPPLAWTPAGQALHPVIFVSDPAPAKADSRPVGVASVGYRSACGAFSAAWARRAAQWAPGRRLVSVAAIAFEPYPCGSVWLPMPEDEQRRRWAAEH